MKPTTSRRSKPTTEKQPAAPVAPSNPASTAPTPPRTDDLCEGIGALFLEALVQECPDFDDPIAGLLAQAGSEARAMAEMLRPADAGRLATFEPDILADTVAGYARRFDLAARLVDRRQARAASAGGAS